MSEIKKRKYIEITIALAILLFVILICTQSYILMPLILLGSIIISYIIYINGIYISLIPLVLSILVVTFLTKNFVLSIIISISYILAGIVVAILLKQNKELKVILTYTILSYLLPIVFIVFIINRVKKINIVEKYYFESVDNILAALKENIIIQMENGLEFPFSISDIEVQFQNVAYTLKVLLPGMLIVLLATISIIVIYSLVNLLRKKDINFDKIPKFTRQKAPKSLIIILVIVFIASGQDNIVSEAMLNMSYILYSFLMFYGLSIIEYYFIKAGINLPYRILLYIIIYILFIPLQLIIPLLDPFRILILLAIIDSFFDLRSINKRGE